MTALPILWDRDAALGAASELLDEIDAGRPRSVFVVGEAGLGKTSVLEHACASAGNRGFAYGIGRGDAMESALPFGVLAQAFAQLGGASSSTRNTTNSTDRTPAPLSSPACSAGCRSQARPPCSSRSDDLHWADPDSLALVSFVCRRLQAIRVGFLGVLRPYPPVARDLADALAHDGLCLRPAPGAADENSGEPLARLAIGTRGLRGRRDKSLGRVRREPVASRTGGAGRGRGRGRPEAECGRYELVRTPAVGALRGTSTSRDALRGGCSGFRYPLSSRPCATALASRRRGRWARHSMRCRGSGLVRESLTGTVEFVHPLFRQALYDDLGAPVCTLLHALRLQIAV